MNRVTRRSMRQDAIKALGRAKGYVLVIQNENGGPVYYGDLSKLNSQSDLRHEYMHTIFEDVKNGAKALEDHAIRKMHEIEQSSKVQDAKDKRSADLAEFSEDEAKLVVPREVIKEFAIEEFKIDYPGVFWNSDTQDGAELAEFAGKTVEHQVIDEPACKNSVVQGNENYLEIKLKSKEIDYLNPSAINDYLEKKFVKKDIDRSCKCCGEDKYENGCCHGIDDDGDACCEITSLIKAMKENSDTQEGAE